MAVLQACQNAIARLVGRRPPSIFASQEEICVEVAALANEAATDMMKSHDWQQLTRIHELVGNGQAEAFPLPADYDRMTAAAKVHDPVMYAWGYQRIKSMDDWIYQKSTGWNLTPGSWGIFDNQMNFVPAPGFGQKAVFPYISKNFAITPNLERKAFFDTDSDEFMLDERLLTLAIIWRWQALKQMDYTEDMRNFEIAFSQETTRDKGAYAVRDRGVIRGNLTAAWPWSLG